MERQYECWKSECNTEIGTGSTPKCDLAFLDCSQQDLPARKLWLNSTKLIEKCDAEISDNTFRFGMFADALTKDLVKESFVSKYLYCLWWGLRNLRYIFLHMYLFLFLFPLALLLLMNCSVKKKFWRSRISE